MNSSALIATAALVGVVGLAAYSAGSGSLASHEANPRPARQTVVVNKPPRQTVVVKNAGPNRGDASVPASNSAPSPTANASTTVKFSGKAAEQPTGGTATNDHWPLTHRAYTVVLASAATWQDAEDVRLRADSSALPWTGVLHSNDFASLRPGYWVAFTGSYDTASDASRAATVARSAGFSDAYPRYVSAD